jgi:hypothetical protein
VQRYAQETAYYLNGKLPCLALVAKGVEFPPGQWIRIASEQVLPWHVQELAADLFPALRGTPVPVLKLLTEFDVQEFERRLKAQPTGPER